MRRLIVVVMLTLSAAASPRNARAAADCARLFHVAGDADEETFFTGLAWREGASVTFPETPAPFALLRTQLTPRNAWDLLPKVEAAGDDALIEVARRALAMHWPKIAAGYAEMALHGPPRPELAPIFLECARAFTPREPVFAQESLRLAVTADPSLENSEEVLWLRQMTLWCDRGQALSEYLRRYPSGPHAGQVRWALVARRYRLCPELPSFGLGCALQTSVFAIDPSYSDQRLFPEATYERPRVRRDRAHEARCRALSPMLFPEPFESARDTAERIGGPDDEMIEHLPPPCIEQSTWDLVIARDGSVESMKVRLAAFPSSADNHDPEAIAVEQQRLEPIVMQQKFRPGTLRGIAVRSETWGGALRDCRSR